MVEACRALKSEDVYKMLMHNFKRHYLTNRAPYGLYFHPAWLKSYENLQALHYFLEEMQRYSDVWFVTKWQAIQWMKHPMPLEQLDTFGPWSCEKKFNKDEIACEEPNVCKLHSRIFQQDRYMETCVKCPEKYPWIRNEYGSE